MYSSAWKISLEKKKSVSHYCNPEFYLYEEKLHTIMSVDIDNKFKSMIMKWSLKYGIVFLQTGVW